MLRYAYMGHANWGIVHNKDCHGFEQKIARAKEFVLDTLGKSGGSCFAKKFLLKKVKKDDINEIPLALDDHVDSKCHETVEVSETFIDYHTNEGEIISCSVEKKGTDETFSYTLKLKIVINKQKILRK